MEQIEVELEAFTLRSRSLPVRHSAARLPRVLEPGEQVVVRDPRAGSYYYAAVADADIEADDACYRLELGSRITSGEAAAWLPPASGPALSAEQQTSARDLVELLAELRRGRRRILAMLEEAH